MKRADGRSCDEMRPVRITTDFVKFPEGSALIECGDTKVLCCASVEERTPPHVKPGHGWVTAEYSMLPRANRERSRRDIDKLKLAGRSAEIQRLIGRSLRAAVDMEALGERTITIDCDVLQGDGGTRTASVTGGFVALALACRKLVEQGSVERNPIRGFAAGIDTIVHVGKDGIGDNLVKQVNDALEARELIKGRVLENSMYTAREAAEELRVKARCEVVQVIGSKFVLYRMQHDKSRRKIELMPERKKRV